MIRVLVADDHPLYRDGVCRSLAESGRFAIAGEAATAEDAVRLAEEVSPDVVLLDISMPGGGLSALRRILAARPGIRVAMLTVSEEDDDVLQALKAGALGYILKGVGARDLVEIVEGLAEGRGHVAPTLARKVLSAMSAPRSGRSAVDALTRREEDILRRVAEGKSNKEVARELDLQEKTVKHYMTAILQKLQVRNRTEAALAARDHLKRN